MENNTNNKLSTPTAIVAAGFLIMLGIVISRSPAPTPKVGTNDNTNPQNQILLNPVVADEHILGDLNTAEVLIVEFSDTECPFCKTFHNAMKSALQKYPNKIAWVYRHFPLDMHKKARTEAVATECVASLAGNDAFWQFLDSIFATTTSNDGLDLSLLPVLAEKVGVNSNDFNNCLAQNNFDALIEEHIKDGTRAGLQGTPYSVIVTKDGSYYPISGANEAQLNSTLEALLK